ncbi:hypothetical protein IAD21_00544 [Abditibacteriota bacterium]|nr:hypothetical protein IAD21_00544 [Abditibacteriota bacterium]
MIKPPIGVSFVERNNQKVEDRAVSRAVNAVQTRSGGASGSLTSGTAPQGADLELDGVSLKGKLGFALGFSGFGGQDYLYPPSFESEAPTRLFWELY